MSGHDGLGDRLLRQMALGLRDDQNDVDRRDAARAQQYTEHSDGYLVNRSDGKFAAAQKYAYDDVYMDAEIAYDKLFDGDSAYQFASDVAGFVNVRIEALGDRDANEHNAAQRRRQEKLLVEERKTRLIAFKDRAAELDKLREARRQTEDVRRRIETVHTQALKPTVDRWYWLASVTGTAKGRKAVPYWLVTDKMHTQYSPGNWRLGRFTADKSYFESDGQNHEWAISFLEAYNAEIFTLLSLSDEQISFATNVYLAFRDSAFAGLLQFKGDSRAIDRVYRGLAWTLDDITGIVARQCTAVSIRTDAVTHNETDPGLPDAQFEFPTAGGGTALVAPNYMRYPVHVFRDMVTAAFPNLRLATFNAGPVDGLTRELDSLLDRFPSGLSSYGFGGTVDLLRVTVLSATLGAPGDLKLVKLLRPSSGAKVSFGDLLLDYTTIPAGPADQQFMEAIAYAILCEPLVANNWTCLLAVDVSNGTATFRIKRPGAAQPFFTATFSKQDTAFLRALSGVFDAFENQLGTIAQPAEGFNNTPLYQSQWSRLILSILVWNTLLPLVQIRTALIADFKAIVLAPAYANRDYGDIRKSFDANLPFRGFTQPTGDGFKSIVALRNNLNLAAHFTRELFRATFAERYSRGNIDKQLLLPADVPIAAREQAFKFVNDVRFDKDEIDVKRPDKALPPPVPPAVANVLAALGPAPVSPPLRLNDPVFFETWEKLYANLFLQNEAERDGAAGRYRPYWRPLFRAQARAAYDPGTAVDGAIPGLWAAIMDQATAVRYLTLRQRQVGGTISTLGALDLKLTEGEDEPDNPIALEFEAAFRHTVSAMPTALATTPAPPLTLLLQGMLIFEDDFYPAIHAKIDSKIIELADVQQKMLDVLYAALTNDPTHALKELKQLAADTYLPDPRFHLQAKFTGRFKFSPQFLTAVRAAYSDLQNLGRLSERAQQTRNVWGKRPVRPAPFDYSALLGVPMDVLTCNTNADPDPANGNAPRRDHIDEAASEPGALTQLRSCMAFLVAQHIFKVRLDAPDEYKTVVQHERSPQQLQEAQQAMTQFLITPLGNRAWRVAFSG